MANVAARGVEDLRRVRLWGIADRKDPLTATASGPCLVQFEESSFDNFHCTPKLDGVEVNV